MNDIWLTVRQAAARVQAGRGQIYRAVKTGKLRAARVGQRKLRFRASDIDRWLEESTPNKASAERSVTELQA